MTAAGRLAGMLVDPVEGVRGGEVVWEDGAITRIEPDDALAGGPYVFPGFVDVQLYACEGAVQDGITGYLATVGTSARGVVDRFLASLPDDPACLGAHVEGPYLNPQKAGAQAEEHIRPVDLGELDAWLSTGRLRMLTLAPEVEGGFDAIRLLVEAGAVPSIGHTAANFYTTRAAIDDGARFATHLWNAMSGWTARAPGAIGTLLADERVTLGLIGDGRHVHPVTEELTVRAAGPRRIALVSDMVGPPQERPDGKLLGGDRRGAAIVERFARRFGLAEAAAMSSLVPAQALGLFDRGRLAPGHRADLAVLDEDFRPLTTVLGGRVAWARPA